MENVLTKFDNYKRTWSVKAELPIVQEILMDLIYTIDEKIAKMAMSILCRVSEISQCMFILYV